MKYVYQIKVDGIVRYIGYTENPTTRQKQHLRDYKKGSSKYLYKKTRETSPETIFELEIIKEFSNKGDAKRWEAYLILKDYFSDRQLWQSFPTSFKYF